MFRTQSTVTGLALIRPTHWVLVRLPNPPLFRSLFFPVKTWTNQICHRNSGGGDFVSNSEPTTETVESGILLSPTFTDLQSYSRTTGCPWVVRTKPGRRINLTLYSFPSATDGADVQSACAMKILILDRNRTTTADLCADGQRQKQIYTSQGNLVRVYVQAGKVREGRDTTVPPGRFLLNFQGSFPHKQRKRKDSH